MTIQYSRIKRFVSITQAPKKLSARFLYYFCLCKSFKELFLYSLAPSFEAKADAKVRLFLESPNISHVFLIKRLQVFVFIDKLAVIHLII